MAATRLPGTPRLLRALNDRAALELLLTKGPLTRAQLGEMTGLSKVTASQLVERLEERGLVRRVGEQAGGRGPNAQLYAVTPGSAYVIGVEVLPDRVIAACADITGETVGRGERSTRDSDDPVRAVHHAVLDAVTDAGTGLDKVRRVMIGTPGLVDPETSEVSFVFDLPGWHRGLLAELRKDLDIPVVFGNDVNLVAIAEQHAGAAKDVDDFVLIWVGRGVGLATVIGGRLHQGSNGAAGEIGYLPIGMPAPHNAAERVKGAFQQLVAAEVPQQLGAEFGIRGDDSAAVVRAAVEAGESGAAFLDELARRIALGVGATCVILDPPLVVLAGEISQAGGLALAERVQAEVASITLTSPKVVVGEVPDEPILQGALRAALDAVRDEVFGSTTG
jgi:predicted NBD/HSP70 family sugar kinase